MLLNNISIKRLVDILVDNMGISVKYNKEDFDELLKKVGLTDSIQSYSKFYAEDVNIHLKEHSNFNTRIFKLENYIQIKLEELNGTKGLFDFVNEFIRSIQEKLKMHLQKQGNLWFLFYDGRLLEVFEKLNERLSDDNYEVIKIEEDNNFRIYSLDDSMVSYGCYFKESEKGQYILINEHCKKCIHKIQSGDYSGAITNSRSLLEQILREVDLSIHKAKKDRYRGRDIKPLLQNVLNSFDVSEGLVGGAKNGYKKLEEGFVSLTEGISIIRHGMSDAHNISHSPTKKDALLAVNTSKTLANFIVEHYFEKFVEGN